MKKNVVALSVFFCCLMTSLSGCSIGYKDSLNESVLSESNNSTDVSVLDSGSGSKPNIGAAEEPSISGADSIIKCHNYTIENNGSPINDIGTGSQYFIAMDNNNFYFSSASYPQTISSVDRTNQKIRQDIMTYDLDVEWGLTTSKRTYCGHYVVFPCYGSPEDEYITLRVMVGKYGEEAKCILEQPTGSIFVCAAELSENEMAFLCTGEQRGTFNIYKYNFNEEKARLIYTKKLDTPSANSNPLIACCDGEIYFVFRTSQNENAYCVRRIDTDGNECGDTILELSGYSDVSMAEFTMTANNILIRFEPTDDNGYFQTVLYNKSADKTFADSGDNGLGVRFNDGLIDGRYILFRAGSKSDSIHPMVCVFDDWTSEFHFITFAAIDNSKIINTVADINGDVVFFVREDDNTTLILFEDMCSLIVSE